MTVTHTGPAEVLRGDILQPDAVACALEGCARVFHVAADYRLWARDPAEIYRNNVDGTRTVLEASARAGVDRVIYTSSVGTLGRRCRTCACSAAAIANS